MLPSAGPAGSQITVEGSGFDSGPVQIRWNSSRGPLVGTAQGPRFSVWIKVPASSSAKVYYVVATQGPYKATEAFEVTPSAGSQRLSAPLSREKAEASASNDLWSALVGRNSASSPGAIGVPGNLVPGPERTLGIALMAAGLSGLLACFVVGVLVKRYRARS